MMSRELIVKWLKGLLGLFILLYLFYVLRDHLVQDLSWDDLPSCDALHWRTLTVVLLLVPVNWGWEALKWQQMMRRSSDWTFAEAFKCTLAGASTAIFTPNRLGDVAGRMVLVSKNHRKDAFWATVLCNLSQLSALLLLGIPGFFLLVYLSPETGYNLSTTAIFLISSGLATAVFISYYFASAIIPFFIDMMPFKVWRNYLRTTLDVLKGVKPKGLHLLLLFSVLRILTYTFQYFLTIHFFGVKLGLTETVAAILSVYLLKTVVPYLPGTGLIVRTELSLWVFSVFTDELTLILAASFLIWLINVVIPAIWGYFLILTTDLKRQL